MPRDEKFSQRKSGIEEPRGCGQHTVSLGHWLTEAGRTSCCTQGSADNTIWQASAKKHGSPQIHNGFVRNETPYRDWLCDTKSARFVVEQLITISTQSMWREQ